MFLSVQNHLTIVHDAFEQRQLNCMTFKTNNKINARVLFKISIYLAFFLSIFATQSGHDGIEKMFCAMFTLFMRLEVVNLWEYTWQWHLFVHYRWRNQVTDLYETPRYSISGPNWSKYPPNNAGCVPTQTLSSIDSTNAAIHFCHLSPCDNYCRNFKTIWFLSECNAVFAPNQPMNMAQIRGRDAHIFSIIAHFNIVALVSTTEIDLTETE